MHNPSAREERSRFASAGLAGGHGSLPPELAFGRKNDGTNDAGEHAGFAKGGPLVPTSPHLPSLQALSVRDDRLLAKELHLIAARQQLALVRTLADEFERCLVLGVGAQTMREQLVQELTRLGCRSLETAAAMVHDAEDVPETSGIHRVVPFAATSRE
jgi:hypothetical protein